jgi:ATP-dependent Lhr-like helicase
VTAFDRLHASLQHHIVNSLGWRELRALQEQAITPVLDGRHCLLLAPTAGGKTEAAVFPLLSRMLVEDWQGLSVLYVCPIRALLNNLEERLSYYAGLVGRSCGLWHGDVSQAVKSRILAEPPDILLTTPESLEALLISSRTDKPHFFGSAKVVVVDEIHAFAGDDRGWHLLALLDRIVRLAGHPLQRIGLSATVGNPEELLHWLVAGSEGEGVIIAPPALAPSVADVTIDYVGNLQNAATVLKLLYAGEKRLVFCDSRARVEELAALLRSEGVPTFVSHSSLSVEERRDAERAFREGRDCVIVATSTLELGIDVGDLDRVIQIDAPATVASFLQRLGRTGRRSGTKRNCLFLATSPAALLQAAALVELWREGYVEPIKPPDVPYHLFAQQVLTILLQHGAVPENRLLPALGGLIRSACLNEAVCAEIVQHMLEMSLLGSDSGLLMVGNQAERLYGAKHYIALLSIFDSPPLFTVFWGPKEIGSVHPISFHADARGGPVILSLAGRSWQVGHIDWDRQTAQVTPADDRGKSRWLGESRPLSNRLCQAVRSVLLDSEERPWWSRRTMEQVASTRQNAPAVAADATVVEIDADRARVTWWTFAGLNANFELAASWPGTVRFDNFSVTLEGRIPLDRIHEWIRAESLVDPTRLDQLPRWKFHECLPPKLQNESMLARLHDRASVEVTRTSRIEYRDSA